MKRLAALLDPPLVRRLPAELAAQPIHQLTGDVRAVTGPALVAVWRGKAHDGHTFLAEAQQRGAVCALVERRVADVTLPQLVVASPRRVLAAAAHRFYDAPDEALLTCGITGTNGKTTCAALLASVLAAWRGSCASIGTLGTLAYGGPLPANLPAAPLTTPEGPVLSAILAALRDANFAGAVLEASSIALAQGRLDGVAFDAVAWTNLSQDHLDDHGDMAAYGAAKALLFYERRKAAGVVVQNADDNASLAAAEPAVAALPQNTRRLAFSARGPVGTSGQAADVWAEGVRCGRDGTQLTLHTPAGSVALATPLVGAFNVENVLLVATVAVALGAPLAAVRRGLADFAGVPGRLERIVAAAANAAHLPESAQSRPPLPARPPAAAAAPHRAAPLVLVDYAHTPDALRRVLAVARELTTGRLWCVFGCGGDRDPSKRGPMGAAVAEAADRAVVTTDNPRTEPPATIAAAVAAGLVASGGQEVDGVRALAAAGAVRAFCVQLDRRLAIRQAVAAAAPGDTVVVAGKGHEAVQIVGQKALPFDDREQARAALAARTTILEDLRVDH